MSYSAFSFLQFVTVLTLVAMGDRLIGRSFKKDRVLTYQSIRPYRFDVVIVFHKQRNVTDLAYELLNVLFVSYISPAREQRLATDDYPLRRWKLVGDHIPFYRFYPDKCVIALSTKYFLVVVDSAAIPKVVPCRQQLLVGKLDIASGITRHK